MKQVLAIVSGLFLLFITGCGNDEPTEREKAYQACIDNGGEVIVALNSDNETVEMCRYTESYTFDDGTQDFTFECELLSYYRGTCEDMQDEAFDSPPEVEECPACKKTVGQVFDGQVTDILMKLDNTGYTHKPLTLLPDYNEFLTTDNTSIESYNLFLDCSGFVAYYVIQGVAPKLYGDFTTCYGASRPLAADIFDVINSAAAYSNNGAYWSDVENDNVCWGRIDHIADALPGDVLVYKHEENISGSGCDNYTISGNTGHVLFVRSIPQKSDVYDNEWVVKVADSTTMPHSNDSRKIDDHTVWEESQYNTNTYTAWSHGDTGTVEQCLDSDNKTVFHRSCSEFGDRFVKKIDIDTIHDYSPTGIGEGYMYVSDNMKHYRNKKSQSPSDATVIVGRAVKCQ